MELYFNKHLIELLFNLKSNEISYKVNFLVFLLLMHFLLLFIQIPIIIQFKVLA